MESKLQSKDEKAQMLTPSGCEAFSLSMEYDFVIIAGWV